MLNYISADCIYPITSLPIQNGILAISEDGVIVRVLTPSEVALEKIENIVHHHGGLVPGLINTHCHLELSHLKNEIPEKTGLVAFIKQILSKRNQPEENVIAAMQKADREMLENGIVAVGDISNVLLSKRVKQESQLHYHTFIEVFGFNAPALETLEKGIALKNQFAPLNRSIVPHAPYSVSAGLFAEISKNTTAGDLNSIHNQETKGENELFEIGSGSFAEFFKDMGIAQSEAHSKGKNSIQYHLPQLHKNVNTLLVHNTLTDENDLDFAQSEHNKLYWCLCPNANLYIEGTLPNVELFIKKNLKITLGTDSLASNHQLNILSEMKTIQENFEIEFNDLLKWATLNGAEFLGIDAQFGSFEPGKKPGINLIQLSPGEGIVDPTQIKRLY